MRTLLTLQRESWVSFVRDPEALGCLLYEIADIAAHAEGEVLHQEIATVVRHLGYTGSIASVRRMLLSKGFLSEIEKCHRYYLHESNKEAMNFFFERYAPAFRGIHLSDAERTLLFEVSHVGGTDAEEMLMRVMKHLSLLLDEFRQLTKIESQVYTTLAKEEASHCVALERVKWCIERLHEIASTATLVSSHHDIRNRILHHRLMNEYERMQDVLAAAIDSAGQSNDMLRVCAHDGEVIQLLRVLREFLLRFADIMLRSEEKISSY